MNRNRFDPLGVSGGAFDAGNLFARFPAAGQPARLDRWLAEQLTALLDSARVRIALWDEPQVSKHSRAPVTVRIGDRAALYRLLLNPGLNFGDLYSAGRITVSGDLLVLLDAAGRYLRKHASTAKASRRGSRPGLADSRHNIHHHYDIGNDFYRLWLDRDALQYTCAYYADKAMTLEQAQQAKMHHVCRKLQLQAGELVAEAGGGWGGFALFMARHYGVKVRSFNISRQQTAHAREWARHEGLDQRVEFVEDDFRNIAGRYDVFVSIGMLEHVGRGNYAQLGRLVGRVLGPAGRGLIHSIGRDRPQALNAWIDRRIFPGAYPPALGEMMDIFEPNGLSVLDVENLRLHYAHTLQHWLERYEQNIDAVKSMFDENFARAWRLYLAGSMMAFVQGDLQLFQVLFGRSGANNIPWTREHLYTARD
jgi:cyclopropane-fatty-acyl-phospholipid synthase